MHSWVRYSVSAYIGLLLAGSLVNPELAPAASEPMAAVQRDLSPIPLPPPPMPHQPQPTPSPLPDHAES